MGKHRGSRTHSSHASMIGASVLTATLLLSGCGVPSEATSTTPASAVAEEPSTDPSPSQEAVNNLGDSEYRAPAACEEYRSRVMGEDTRVVDPASVPISLDGPIPEGTCAYQIGGEGTRFNAAYTLVMPIVNGADHAYLIASHPSNEGTQCSTICFTDRNGSVSTVNRDVSDLPSIGQLVTVVILQTTGVPLDE